MPEDGVKVEVLGLDELADGSKALVARIRNAAPAEFEHVAEAVARVVRSRVPVLTGRLQSSVEVDTTGRTVQVSMGGGVPYAGWIEFGGTRPDGSTRQYIGSGRYLFPAAAGDASRASKAYTAALEKLFGSAGIWTNTTSNGGQVHD